MSKVVLERLRSRFGDKVLESSSFRGDDAAIVDASVWYEAAQFLRDDAACDMSMFIDMTCVDYPRRDARFELVLHLYSLHKGHRVRLKARVAEGEDGTAHIKTLTPIWAAVNWFEREVWDMFGVRFDGHPDPRRLLMYEEFEGHPLRKDYAADKTQPLVPYRTGPDILGKLAPFLADEGMPFGRNDWVQRDAAWTDEDVGDRADAPPPDGTAPTGTH
jgi:NADH-quinone oxidoreductase subunit C